MQKTKVTKLSAHQVVNTILLKCENQHDENLTNLKLNNMLYFMQCSYIHDIGSPLFYEDFEAWSGCAAVPDVYSRFNCISTIYRNYKELHRSNEQYAIKLSKEQEAFVIEAIGLFKHVTEYYLYNKLKTDQAWTDIRSGIKGYEKCSKIIPKNKMRGRNFLEEIKQFIK